MKCAANQKVGWSVVLTTVGALAASCGPASIIMDDGPTGGASVAATGGHASINPGTGGVPGAYPWNTGGSPIVTNGTVTVSDPEHCPAAPPSGACTAEGQACGYWWDSATRSGTLDYAELGCLYDNQGALVWRATERTGGLSCARGTLVDGSDCWGNVGLQCPMPLLETCTCPTGTTTPTWECATSVPDALRTGPSVDPNQPLADLTATERETWCRWYLTWGLPPGAPDPLDAPVGADGYLFNTSAYWGSKPYDDVCLCGSSIAQCAANLGLTSCELPVWMLTDCVVTVISTGVPSPHGCGQYMATPGCAGTVVAFKPTLTQPGDTACTIRVQ